MKTIAIPRPACSFPSHINPFAEEATLHTNAWVQQFELHSGDAFQKYIGDNFGLMTARFYPGADKNRLLLANDINVLLFVMDDDMDNQVDRTDLTKTRNHFEAFISQCNQILRQPTVQLPSTGVFAALQDVWLRLIAISDTTWQQNFIISLEKMFQAGLWEYDNVVAQRLPTAREFYEKRQYLGAAHISTDMITVIENISLPEEILNHPSVVELVTLARNAVCWANDLFSLTKEIEHKDKHNMVLILQLEHNLTLEAAIEQTVIIHNDDMARFEQVAASLPAFSPSYDKALSRFIEALANILKGNMDWSEKETRRYSFVYQTD